MKKPTLVIMAAGIGSRYGGLKQIDPVGPGGEIIIDYSTYDAIKAGFGKIVFIIKKEMEEAFRDKVGKRVEQLAETDYVFQDIGNIPNGFDVPEGRKKPWGTAHAVLSCGGKVDSPFAVINADDFYGPSSFQILHDFLIHAENRPDSHDYCMVGFQLENTLTEHGHVARGICTVSGDGYLRKVDEQTRIRKFPDGVKYTEDGESWVDIPEGSMASMNTWGFTTSVFKELEDMFPKFLNANKDRLVNAEYLLPSAVDTLLQSGKATVKALKSRERWYGVTYQEDRPVVRQAISDMVRLGIYPRKLW